MLLELKYINTITGPILKEDFLKKEILVLAHEHLFHDLTKQTTNYQVRKIYLIKI